MKHELIEYIIEAAAGKGLTIFDIDETLFHTKAKINIKRDGKVVGSLNNVEYNNYKLKPGEEFDYGQFKSAKIFAKNSASFLIVSEIPRFLLEIIAFGFQIQSQQQLQYCLPYLQ